MDRKKELKQQYKQMRPKMGVFIVKCKVDSKCYIQSTGDLRGVMNGCTMRLSGGIHPFAELQIEWSELGANNFTIEVLEELPYDADESKTDYTDDLALLQMIWEDKLRKEGFEFYQKRMEKAKPIKN